MILHAGLVALRLEGVWRGALIAGPSGVGKSDLALRAIEAGFRLVADDRAAAAGRADRGARPWRDARAVDQSRRDHPPGPLRRRRRGDRANA